MFLNAYKKTYHSLHTQSEVFVHSLSGNIRHRYIPKALHIPSVLDIANILALQSLKWDLEDELLQRASERLVVLRNCAQHFDVAQEAWYKYGHKTLTGNAYLNGANVTGLPPHSDPYDIVVLQLAGSKRWYLLGHRPDVVTLRAGDILCIPKGLRHETCVPAESKTISIHLSLHAQEDEDLLKQFNRSP